MISDTPRTIAMLDAVIKHAEANPNMTVRQGAEQFVQFISEEYAKLERELNEARRLSQLMADELKKRAERAEARAAELHENGIRLMEAADGWKVRCDAEMLIRQRIESDLAAANAKLAAKPDVAGLVERLRNPRITFCSMDDAADALLSLSAQLAEKEAECAGLREVIYWALGERGPFPDRPEGWDKMQYKPWYWWRTELRQKLDAAIAARKP